MNTGILKFKLSTTLNKGIIAALLLALFLLMVPQQGLAASSVEEGEAIAESYESFYDDIVSPLYIPCDYWQDGSHRYQNGRVDYEYVKRSSPHNHVINGVTFKNCYISDVYKVQHKYCACGMKTSSKSKIREDHSVE